MIVPSRMRRAKSLKALFLSGFGFVRHSLAGQKPEQVRSGTAFARSVVRALRPHFFVLPAGATLAGAAAMPVVPHVFGLSVAAIAAGVGWGVGQLLNDLFDAETDAVAAPERVAQRGDLPEGPTLLVALLLGSMVGLATILVHRRAYVPALAAVLLLVAYGPAKARGLGNLAHAALIATATFIGALAADPSATLGRALIGCAPAAVASGTWAAIYLQSNYEKDLSGDRSAGYRTPAHWLGLRLSASVRAVLALLTFGWALHAGLLATTFALAAMCVALGLLLVSVLYVLFEPSERAALLGYRFAVHAAALGMLTFGSKAVGDRVFGLLALLSALLTERAFARTGNP